MLIEAGLGEKRITFQNVDCSTEEYRQQLLDEFPKLLDAGGFEMMRCSSNRRLLECLAPSAFQSPRATQDRVGPSKVYLRPIQKDLDVNALDEGSSMTDTARTVVVLEI